MIVLARAAVALALVMSLQACSSRCGRVAPEVPVAPESTAPSAPTAPESTAPTAPTAPEPSATVGTLPLGAACGAGLGACDGEGYCEFPAEAPCGDGGVVGRCVERPRGCFKDCPGVCGCDGLRHCNACATESRGISVRHAGACGEEEGR